MEGGGGREKMVIERRSKQAKEKERVRRYIEQIISYMEER